MEHIKKIQTYSRIYNIVFGTIYLLYFCCLLSLLLLGMIGQNSEYDMFSLFFFLCVILLFLPIIFFHFIVASIIGKRTKYVYYANIVALAFGFTGFITAVPATILLIKWIEKDVKDYYLKTDGSSA